MENAAISYEVNSVQIYIYLWFVAYLASVFSMWTSFFPSLNAYGQDGKGWNIDLWYIWFPNAKRMYICISENDYNYNYCIIYWLQYYSLQFFCKIEYITFFSYIEAVNDWLPILKYAQKMSNIGYIFCHG